MKKLNIGFMKDSDKTCGSDVRTKCFGLNASKGVSNHLWSFNCNGSFVIGVRMFFFFFEI